MDAGNLTREHPSRVHCWPFEEYHEFLANTILSDFKGRIWFHNIPLETFDGPEDDVHKPFRMVWKDVVEKNSRDINEVLFVLSNEEDIRKHWEEVVISKHTFFASSENKNRFRVIFADIKPEMKSIHFGLYMWKTSKEFRRRLTATMHVWPFAHITPKPRIRTFFYFEDEDTASSVYEHLYLSYPLNKYIPFIEYMKRHVSPHVAVLQADLSGSSVNHKKLEDAGFSATRIRNIYNNFSDSINAQVKKFEGTILTEEADDFLVMFANTENAAGCALSILQEVPSFNRECGIDEIAPFSIRMACHYDKCKDYGLLVEDGKDQIINTAGHLQKHLKDGLGVSHGVALTESCFLNLPDGEIKNCFSGERLFFDRDDVYFYLKTLEGE